MTIHRTLRVALLAGTTPLAASAQGIEFGPEMQFVEGTVRNFAENDAPDLATCIDIEITEEALRTLGHDMIFITMPLPEAALDAGYDQNLLDCMLHGQAPGDLFGVPHFDVHFYMTTEADRLTIDPADPPFVRFISSGKQPGLVREDVAIKPGNRHGSKLRASGLCNGDHTQRELRAAEHFLKCAPEPKLGSSVCTPKQYMRRALAVLEYQTEKESTCWKFGCLLSQVLSC